MEVECGIDDVKLHLQHKVVCMHCWDWNCCLSPIMVVVGLHA